MALFLASHWENGWAVMEVRGVLDTTTAEELRDFVAAVTAKHKHLLNLIADLSELTYTDADALSPLATAHTMLERDGGELRVVCPEGRVERILEASGLARVLPVYPSLDAALAGGRPEEGDGKQGPAR
jgi:anti-anti-sigma factor